jgi:putative Mg2+ transporter-C (MgtC) family protein
MDIILVKSLALASLFGAIIGLEREYRSKAAGFRTITIITLGSTLFTIISCKLGTWGGSQNPDRIASNIITGIGFIGAGVIFKDNFSISGLTTAATIWVSAAIGMAIGIGEYMLATVTFGIAMIVLALFEQIQDWVDVLHQVKTYKITFHLNYEKAKQDVEQYMKLVGLEYKIRRSLRTNDEVVFFYSVAGSQKKIDALVSFLIELHEVKAFDE